MPRLLPAPAIGTLPLYNFDIQQEHGFPPPVLALCDAIRAADGVIFVTPEYNYSIPGVLKNAIDWVSRVPRQPFLNKAVAIQSARQRWALRTPPSAIGVGYSAGLGRSKR